MRPLTPREIRSLEKKTMMLDKALELFDSYGYEQTTVRQICAASGMTTGSFYNFFHDKLGLLRELYVRILEEGRPLLEPTEDHLKAPFQTIFDYFVSMSSVYASLRPSVARQIYTEASRLLSGQYDARYEDTALGGIITFLKTAQKAGTVPAGLDPSNTAVYLIGVSMGTTNYWLYRTNNMDYSQAAELILIPAFRAVTDEHLVNREISQKRGRAVSRGPAEEKNG